MPKLELDATFRALADGGRRDLLTRLAERPLTVTELAEPLDLSLAAVVARVQLLESGGLITTTKSGRVRTCNLRPEGLDVVTDWVTERRRLWERRLDRLDAVLDQRHGGAR